MYQIYKREKKGTMKNKNRINDSMKNHHYLSILVI